MAVRSGIALLVKARGIGAAGQLAMGATSATFTATPIMPHLQHHQAGLGLTDAAAQWYQVEVVGDAASAWEACHAMLRHGLGPGVAGAAGDQGVVFAEPDFTTRWPTDADRTPEAMALAASCAAPAAQDPRFPRAPCDLWYRDPGHGGFDAAMAALDAVPPAKRSTIRVAHLDTGYDPAHAALPATLRRDLQRNFVAGEDEHDATDDVRGPLTNRGHGTGTMSVLAGRDPADPTRTIGAAPFVEVVPIRVANRVVLFSSSAVARALDYVLSLKDTPDRIDVVTMSMGGLASQAWAEGVNALYEAGIFVVTAAGNNFANLPTRNIVFPARFNRVVAACGIMADGTPYADLAPLLMAGNYGPPSKMATAIAASTPNLPWARLGCEQIVDHDGRGTSAATPQVAAAAAIWLAAYRKSTTYAAPWMLVEAVRAALFGSARAADLVHCGRGSIDAAKMIGVKPAAATALVKQPVDKADFAFLRVLLGIGLAAPDPQQQAMLELEALQLSQSAEIERIMPDPGDPSPDPALRATLAAALAADPRASRALRVALAGAAPASPDTPAPDGTPPVRTSHRSAAQLARAKAPSVPTPLRRRLRVFAADPTLGTGLETYQQSVTTVDMPWEDLAPGPIGEYLEVIDVDPASGAAYAPVDLDDHYLLSTDGLAPSETDPRFHQQMAYAVASRTIEHFERALGRRALWSPYHDPASHDVRREYVPRLRIYPHAMRAANAYYSPAKKALLLGYFAAHGDPDRPGTAPPAVFAALSHDVIAHETAHALLDGLHRRFVEPTNPDVLAFHEAFADIVAMFQHFTLVDAVRPVIAQTGGDLFKENRLGQLAVQFGQAIGQRGALRDYIGTVDAAGVWHPRPPHPDDYANATDAHDRGAVLVAAVFEAFLRIYKVKAAEIMRLATGGSGLVAPGDLAPSLVDALTDAACQIAGRFLDIAIRGLDYCPPIDITFGEYLRAVITADLELVPDDARGYRVAIVAAFKARGIAPPEVRSVSPDTLAWEPPDQAVSLKAVIDAMDLDWPMSTPREVTFNGSNANAAIFHQWLVSNAGDETLAQFGVRRAAGPLSLVDADGNVVPGNVRGPEVHSVRTLRRVGPDATIRTDLIIEITQSWRPAVPDGRLALFRGGCTLIVDRTTPGQHVTRVIRKRIDNQSRFASQSAFAGGAGMGLRATYFDDGESAREPFAALHSHFFE